MNKKQMVAAVAEKTGLTKKDAAVAVNAVFETVKEAVVAGDAVALVGFGTFKTVERAARDGRNPQTGATMHIPACKAPKFRAGKAFKAAVNA